MTNTLMEPSAYAQMSFTQINAGIRTLPIGEIAQKQSLRALGVKDLVARVLKVYAGMKALLATLTVIPILPASWRAGIVLFMQSLDALEAGVAGAGDGWVAQQFKAGKDQAGRKRGANASLTFRPIRKVARDARTGAFITRAEAHRRPSSTVVETVKYPPRPASRKG